MAVGGLIDRSRWPRHVTVCPNFRSGLEDVDVLTLALGRVAANSSIPAATVGVDAQFGPSGETTVQIVESSDLHRLHAILMDALEGVVRVDSIVPEHNRSGYRPHVTIVDGHRLEPGSALELGTLLLVEIAPERDRSMAVSLASIHLNSTTTTIMGWPPNWS
jgi:hypothetical protein